MTSAPGKGRPEWTIVRAEDDEDLRLATLKVPVGLAVAVVVLGLLAFAYLSGAF